ncbi:MAG: MBG domain-containing protein, partial [Prosthecobacter sp.]
MNPLATTLIAVCLTLTLTLSAQVPDTLLHSIPAPPVGVQSEASHGYSVAADGDYTVVGSPSDDLGKMNSGVVKVFNTTTGALLFLLPNPGPADGDAFGHSVAISGTRVVVGASFDNTGATGAGSAYVYDLSSGTPMVPVATLNNPEPAFRDYFGLSVAISGTIVVVGAYGNDTGEIDAGSAYVYDISNGAPTVPVVTLNKTGPTASDWFGNSVAISGTRVVVGAHGDNTGATDAGSAYVYDLSSITPASPVATLNNPRSSEGDHFGKSVAISGARVVVGTNLVAGSRNEGCAYVYDLSSGTPTLPMAELANPVQSAYDNFGYSVAISGMRVVVGDYLASNDASLGGSAYVYDLSGGAPAVPVVTMNNPTPAAGDFFGWSVAISGARAVVGAFQDDTGASGAGSAYIYDLSSSDSTLPVVTENNPGPSSNDNFGNTVAISGNFMVVGAPYDNDTGMDNAGSAYVYDLSADTPMVPVAALNNPVPAASDFFGWSVAISGSRVVVGAYLNDTGATDAGSAYVYDLSSAVPTLPVITLNNPGPAAEDNFGKSVAISGTRVVVGASLDDTGANNSGAAYVYDLNSRTPAVPVTTLNNPSPAASDYFGYAVSISGTRVVVGAYADDTGASEAGSVYVYDLSSPTSTAPAATLNNPSPSAQDFFGYSVAISGTRVVVGAPYDSFAETGPSNTGSAYVYDMRSGTPTQPVTKLNNPSPAYGDYFGNSVAISGTRVVVCADADDTGVSDVGSVYVFDLSSGMPTVPSATLYNPSPSAQDFFGHSVAIDGATIAIGAPFDDTVMPNKGSAYIFGPDPLLPNFAKAQNLVFTPPSKLHLAESPFTLSASTNSGLPVAFTLISGPATLLGNVLTLNVAGTVKLRATQAGDADFLAATSVDRTITVAANPTTLTLSNLSQIYTGTPRPITVLGATGPVDVTYKVGLNYVPTPPINVGSYPVKVGTKTGTLVITKAPLFVQPDDQRKFAGQVNPVLGFSYSGFLDDDNAANSVSKAPVIATTATATSAGGLYPITSSGGTSANYQFVYLK